MHQGLAARPEGREPSAMIGSPFLKWRTELFAAIVCSPSSERWTKMGTLRSKSIQAFSSSSSSVCVFAFIGGSLETFNGGSLETFNGGDGDEAAALWLEPKNGRLAFWCCSNGGGAAFGRTKLDKFGLVGGG